MRADRARDPVARWQCQVSGDTRIQRRRSTGCPAASRPGIRAGHRPPAAAHLPAGDRDSAETCGGEKADVILLPVPLIAATEKTVPLRSEGRIVLARVGIGAIVRQGTTPPDISTAEAVRKMLLGARAIAWADPSTPVGGHLDRTIAQLGIAHEVRPKLIIKAAIHGGADLVAKGDADFGLYLVSEVQAAKGITLVGLLPAPFQSFVVYGAAVPGHNPGPEAALAFVQVIFVPCLEMRWKAAGFELVGAR